MILTMGLTIVVEQVTDNLEKSCELSSKLINLSQTAKKTLVARTVPVRKRERLRKTTVVVKQAMTRKKPTLERITHARTGVKVTEEPKDFQTCLQLHATSAKEEWWTCPDGNQANKVSVVLLKFVLK